MSKLGIVTEEEEYFWLKAAESMWEVIDVVDAERLTYDQTFDFISKLIELGEGDVVDEALAYAQR